MPDPLVGPPQDKGASTLTVENGSVGFFGAGRKLYEKRGFTYCEPFGDYGLDPNSVFMTKAL